MVGRFTVTLFLSFKPFHHNHEPTVSAVSGQQLAVSGQKKSGQESVGSKNVR